MRIRWPISLIKSLPSTKGRVMTEQKKNKPGRPTKYRPEMCQQVIDYMKEGKSLTQVSVLLGISKETLYQWKDTYPDFSDAIKVGIDAAQAWWEEFGQQKIGEGSNAMNATAYIFTMKNRFKDYSDTIKTEHSGKLSLSGLLDEIDGRSAGLPSDQEEAE